jgi:hypothetical protein
MRPCVYEPESIPWQQNPSKADRCRLLDDALILLGAHEAGAVLVTRNVMDVDLLLRFRPESRVLVYDRAK